MMMSDMVRRNIAPPYSVDEGPVEVQPDFEIWVRSGDNVQKLAAKIEKALGEYLYVDMACIGAASVNQEIKALSVARAPFIEKDRDLSTIPYFSTVIDAKGRERTRMVLRVYIVE